jgi:hypothetical protein
MLRHMALVRTDISEEPSASIIRETRIVDLGTASVVTSNWRTLRRNTNFESIFIIVVMVSELTWKDRNAWKKYTSRKSRCPGRVLSRDLPKTNGDRCRLNICCSVMVQMEWFTELFLELEIYVKYFQSEPSIRLVQMYQQTQRQFCRLHSRQRLCDHSFTNIRMKHAPHRP